MSIINNSILRASLVFIAIVGGASNLPAQTQSNSADRDAVRRAVLDYVEGFYEGDSIKFERSVAPSVYKYGYARRPDGYRGTQMPYDQFMAYAESVKDGRRNKAPEGAPKEIDLYDVQDQTASAKLTASWGIDYLLLGKQADGRWMITHVLWQSMPARK